MAKTSATRQKEYRQRQKEKGGRATSGRSKTKWKNAEFIALDGEGESIGEFQKFTVGKDGKTYFAKEHIYTMLAASSGESLFNGGARLETFSCLDFLCDMADEHPKAIFVIFAGSYDINHMLMYGLDKQVLLRISRGETVELTKDDVKYSIEYRARKSLTIKRGLSFISAMDKKTGKGYFKAKWQSRIVIWDVFGFFQESFVVVIEKWLGKDWPHYELIKDMKMRRGDFANVEQSVINNYNAAELESLVAIMQKVRDAVDGLELQCRRWDGAGSIAAAIMRKHDVKQFKKITAKELELPVRTAYAGGRIEVCKIGQHRGKVYDYDVNSAYPFVMVALPCLAHGDWVYGESDPPSGFTLVHCRFDFSDDMPFYPLFYRTEKMQISFPQQGEGWYWWPEFEAAQQMPGHIEIIEWWHFKPSCNHKPFHWIPDYYKTRQEWVKRPTEEWQKGGEKIIKLGLNSLYGKTAQQIGGKTNEPPAYHQLEWAGYITSKTRARLFTAAISDPDAIIGFATDGIFTTRELPIQISREKKMGEWELKEPVPDSMTIAMAGVYWWHYGDTYSHFSRGFDKDSMKTPHLILNAWKNNNPQIDIPMHRLIGMGSACASETLWEMRGRFTEGFRTLKLNGKSHKRQGLDVARAHPHEKICALEPGMNIEYMSESQACSFAYPIVWLDIQTDDDYEKELEEHRENMDTENI